MAAFDSAAIATSTRIISFPVQFLGIILFDVTEWFIC